MPATTQPNIGLVQGWADNETAWGSPLNADLRALDGLVQAIVLDKDLATPPGSPTMGDMYIVASTPTGAWVGHTGEIARYNTASWEFYLPKNGWRVWVNDENTYYEFRASAWTIRTGVISMSPVSIHNHFAQFNGTTGDLLWDGGIHLDTDTALAANSDFRVVSQKAVKAYVDGIVAAQDAMVFKGVIDCSGNPNYPAGSGSPDSANRGDTYRISVAGKIGGASGTNVEVGDMIICLTDGVPAGNQATVGAYWGIIQANIDGAVTGPASVTDSFITAFDGSTGKLIKSAGGTFSTLLASSTHAATSKATPVDADELELADSAATFGLKKLTWANLKTALLAQQPQDHELDIFWPGVQASSSQTIFRYKFAFAITYPADFAGSQFTASANATGSTVFSVKKNGSTFGTVTIGAGGVTATFVISGSPSVGISFAVGDVLSLVGPASADASLADMGFTFIGTR
jgi:hypothetical protein